MGVDQIALVSFMSQSRAGYSLFGNVEVLIMINTVGKKDFCPHKAKTQSTIC